MTNQTVTLDAKVVDQVIDALDAGYTPGLKDALKVLRAAKADSRTGETTMTTLQEASTKALDALRKAMQGNLDFDVALEAFEALRTALAQQGEQQPVAGLNRSYTEQLINALHENSDPVSIDAAEEFQRLLAA